MEVGIGLLNPMKLSLVGFLCDIVGYISGKGNLYRIYVNVLRLPIKSAPKRSVCNNCLAIRPNCHVIQKCPIY